MMTIGLQYGWRRHCNGIALQRGTASDTSPGLSNGWMRSVPHSIVAIGWSFFSRSSAAVSKWVKRELTYALDEDRYEGRIVPLLVEDCEFTNLAWPLRTLQIIPFHRFHDGCRALLALWDIRYRATGK